MAEYDPDNVFAKIIDGKTPCNKVFESKASIAMLDLFPMVEGHTLLIPKAKGYVEFVDMPPFKASEFLRDLQKVAAAVKKATGATGVNIWQNNGADAGQVVMHPHFHIVPRFADDKLHSYPQSGEKLSDEKAEPVLKKIQEALNPPKPLKKAKFDKVSSLNPDSKGLNLKVKVVEAPEKIDVKGKEFYEVLVGDESGTVVMSLRDNQKEMCTEGSVLAVRNAAVRMVQGHIRLLVDKWGKVEPLEGETMDEVLKDKDKNVSATEYELVRN